MPKNTLDKTDTRTRTRKDFAMMSEVSHPCLLVAFARPGASTVDRCQVKASYIIGRSSDCDLAVSDINSSKRHIHIKKISDDFWIEDLGSKNGTFVDGSRLLGKKKLSGSEVIRMGELVFVFHSDAELLKPIPGERFGLAGDFHSGPLIDEIRAATLSERHILLGGPTGSGKELVAQIVALIMAEQKERFPFVAHNSARFTSEEEATSTLFGVAPRVFSNVDGRPGLIEQASGGALFLDEIHNLPKRVQRSLLRIIENGRFSRIGETRTRQVNVSFILASNAPGPEYSLAHDLLARLRIVRIPSLEERVADIPSIFNHLLRKSFSRFDLDSSQVERVLTVDHFELLCLDGFPNNNVRGLEDLVDRIATYLKTGLNPDGAVDKVFQERFASSPIANRYRDRPDNNTCLPDEKQDSKKVPKQESHYEQHKEIIIEIFTKCQGNLAATERMLHERGIPSSRRWLTAYIDRWGLPRKKKK
ncbi:MAG: FHA domain-containing protein [Proteobacteria bacterium]|nr:FHA domain-containing protein [Pseudomonadota bacterium]